MAMSCCRGSACPAAVAVLLQQLLWEMPFTAGEEPSSLLNLSLEQP